MFELLKLFKYKFILILCSSVGKKAVWFLLLQMTEKSSSSI